MPCMDGTGPRRFENRMAPGCGGRRGAGAGYGNGYGMGFCRYAAMDNENALNAEKAVLQQRLTIIDKRLSEL
ncbi:MAG: hypothetical protein EOM14_06175 [Clostridia bacterium]|nr:hypothetical protein [Clostridia bacterium]